MFAQLADILRQPVAIAIGRQAVPFERVECGGFDHRLCLQNAQRLAGCLAVVEDQGSAGRDAGGACRGCQRLPDLFLLLVPFEQRSADHRNGQRTGTDQQNQKKQFGAD